MTYSPCLNSTYKGHRDSCARDSCAITMVLSDAIDAGYAALAHNRCPEGWRKGVDFGEVLAHVAPGVIIQDEIFEDDYES